jgi:hypothetical protein
LTSPCYFEILLSHTVTTEQKKKHMRTKTLLIAAAALAVSAGISMAQTYSQNIVGYANVVVPAGQYIMAANPLTTGNDVLTNVIVGAPGASVVQIWNGTTWVGYTYSAPTKHWKNGTIIGDNTALAPGTGFFLTAPSNFTNTFVGTVMANTGGGTATNVLSTGFAPVGSPLPYADTVTNKATFNLQVAGASILQQWDPVAQGFRPAFTYSAPTKNWKQGTVVTNPVINVAEGFFLSPAIATNWVQTLP